MVILLFILLCYCRKLCRSLHASDACRSQLVLLGKGGLDTMDGNLDYILNRQTGL